MTHVLKKPLNFKSGTFKNAKGYIDMIINSFSNDYIFSSKIVYAGYVLLDSNNNIFNARYTHKNP